MLCNISEEKICALQVPSNAQLHYILGNIQNGIVLCSWRVADKTVEHWLEASREAKRIKLLAHKASRGLSHQDRDRNSAFMQDIKTISINFYACYLWVVTQTFWVRLNKIFPEWTQLDILCSHRLQPLRVSGISWSLILTIELVGSLR